MKGRFEFPSRLRLCKKVNTREAVVRAMGARSGSLELLTTKRAIELRNTAADTIHTQSRRYFAQGKFFPQLAHQDCKTISFDSKFTWGIFRLVDHTTK
jgi:hypothetical protein